MVFACVFLDARSVAVFAWRLNDGSDRGIIRKNDCNGLHYYLTVILFLDKQKNTRAVASVFSDALFESRLDFHVAVNDKMHNSGGQKMNRSGLSGE